MLFSEVEAVLVRISSPGFQQSIDLHKAKSSYALPTGNQTIPYCFFSMITWQRESLHPNDIDKQLRCQRSSFPTPVKAPCATQIRVSPRIEVRHPNTGTLRWQGCFSVNRGFVQIQPEVGVPCETCRRAARCVSCPTSEELKRDGTRVEVSHDA